MRWIWSLATTAAMTAFFAILILRYGLRLAWAELTIPVPLFVLLQVAFVAGVLWAGKRRRPRIAAPMGGAYFVALFWMLAHYGAQWGLHTGLEQRDFWMFSGFAAAVVVALVLMPQRWVKNWNGVKCVRCGHYHEGRDCSCGCMAIQFKYPVIGL